MALLYTVVARNLVYLKFIRDYLLQEIALVV